MKFETLLKKAKKEKVFVGGVHPDEFSEWGINFKEGKFDDEDVENYCELVVKYSDYLNLKRRFDRLKEKSK